MDDDFEMAAQMVAKNKHWRLSNDDKLLIYAYYKQGTVGNCADTKQKPSFLDFVGRAKWDSWNSVRDLSMELAKEKYVALVNRISSQQQHQRQYEYQEHELLPPPPPPEENNPLGTVSFSRMRKTTKEYREDDFCDIQTLKAACSKDDLEEFLKVYDRNIHSGLKDISILHWAVDFDAMSIVEWLITKDGFDVNITDDQGQTPLHLAYTCDSPEMISLLLRLGGDPSIKDHEGLIPSQQSI